MPKEHRPRHGSMGFSPRKRSASHIPHFTFVAEVDMTEVVALRAALNDGAADAARVSGVKLSYLPFIIRALVPALRAFPALNASLDDERQEIVLKKRHHIGIATATEAAWKKMASARSRMSRWRSRSVTALRHPGTSANRQSSPNGWVWPPRISRSWSIALRKRRPT